MANPNPAFVRLFATTELAEAIFLQLSPSDLLCRVQQTCRFWKRIVDTSEHIQEFLFFKPISETRLMPLIMKGKTQWYDIYDRNNQFIVPVENPFLFMLGNTLHHYDDIATASWRKMLLAQPPPRLVHAALIRSRGWWNEGVDWAFNACGEDGLRMVELAESGDIRVVRGSWAWKAFESHEQLQKLKKDIRLGRERTDLRELLDDLGEGSFTWILNWIR